MLTAVQEDYRSFCLEERLAESEDYQKLKIRKSLFTARAPCKYQEIILFYVDDHQKLAQAIFNENGKLLNQSIIKETTLGKKIKKQVEDFFAYQTFALSVYGVNELILESSDAPWDKPDLALYPLIGLIAYLIFLPTTTGSKELKTAIKKYNDYLASK